MRSILTLPLALVVLGAVACGGANADVSVPTTAIAAPPPTAPPSRPTHAPAVEQRTALVPPTPAEGAELQAKQGEGVKDAAPAEGAGENDVTRAQAENDARANAEQMAKEKVKWEKAGRDIERKAAYEDARDRVSRASARVAQTQNQLSRIPPARRGKYNTDLSAFGSRKADVQTRMGAIQAYGSDEWRRAREELYRALDELDAAATRVENDLF